MMVTFGFPLRSTNFWRFSGTAGVGTMWVATRYRPSWEGLTVIGHWFLDRYREKYNDFPPDTVLTHFTDVTIIAAALHAARSDTREDLLDAPEATEFGTWRGPIRYERGPSHWHHAVPELLLLRHQKLGQSFDESAILWSRQIRTAEFLSYSHEPGEPEDTPVVPAQRTFTDHQLMNAATQRPAPVSEMLEEYAEVTAHIDGDAIAQIFDPATYLGSSATLTMRTVARKLGEPLALAEAG